MARLTSELVLSLIDKVTAPARGVASAINNMQSRLEANNQRLDAMRGRMVEAAAVGYSLARAIQAPVTAALEFESAMADVRKVVDFSAPNSFKQMSADIIRMSTEIPIAATGIADIIAAAGQAGMAGDELLAFTEIAAKVGVAFDMTAGDVGEALAKIKTQLQISVEDTGSLADAINHLSNTSASSAPDIVNFMKRVAATGEQYGFTATQTAAIGSAMIAAGAEAEVAATSFRNVGRALAKGGTATERQSEAFERLGLDVVRVAERFNEDAVGTLRDVITRINELPAHLRSNTLSEIFGDEARALAPLVTNIELYDNALASVADQASYLGSSQKEFEARAATTSNAMQLFQNKITAAGIAIGSALLPALNDIMDRLGPIVMAIARFADENPRLTSTVIALTAGLVGLRVAAIAAQFAFFWMRGAYLSAAIAGLKGIGGGLKAATLAFTPFTAAARSARSAMVGFAASASIIGTGGALKQVGASLIGLLNPMRLVTGAIRVMKVALISTGIGAILVAIGTAGAWIYQNWAGIKEMFSGIAEGIKTAFPAASGIIDGVSSAVSTLFGWFQKLTGPVDATAQEWRAFGVTVGEQIGGIIAAVAEFPGKVLAILSSIDLSAVGLSMMTSLLNGIKNGAQAALDYVSGIGSRIKGSISSAASSAWSSVKSAVGAGGGVDGARAAGGPIAGGRTYLVGEQGPELITPSRSGYVHTAKETAAMAGRGGGASGVTISSLTVNVAEASNARQISQEIGRALQTELAGIQTNSGWAVA